VKEDTSAGRGQRRSLSHLMPSEEKSNAKQSTSHLFLGRGFQSRKPRCGSSRYCLLLCSANHDRGWCSGVSGAMVRIYYVRKCCWLRMPFRVIQAPHNEHCSIPLTGSLRELSLCHSHRFTAPAPVDHRQCSYFDCCCNSNCTQSLHGQIHRVRINSFRKSVI
jgi:hypothetical protein